MSGNELKEKKGFIFAVKEKKNFFSMLSIIK